jgi:periplasmic copper chaperone A
MMTKTLLASALLLGLSANLLAAGVADSVQVGDPYVRGVPPGQPNSAAFMTLTNTGGTDQALVAAESAASKVVELHTHIMEEGMMKMRKVEKIDLPAGQPVSLQPGGLHIMLIGLQQELVPDQPVTLHLVFDDGSKQEIQAPVRKLPMKMGDMPKGEMHHAH